MDRTPFAYLQNSVCRLFWSMWSSYAVRALFIQLFIDGVSCRFLVISDVFPTALRGYSSVPLSFFNSRSPEFEDSEFAQEIFSSALRHKVAIRYCRCKNRTCRNFIVLFVDIFVREEQAWFCGSLLVTGHYSSPRTIYVQPEIEFI